MTRASPDLSTEEQKGLILAILIDFAENVDDLFAYLRQVGFPHQVLRSAMDLTPAWLAFYRIRPGIYDVERAFRDLRFWLPIAARIAVLQAEVEARAEASVEAAVEPESLPDDL